LLDTRDAGDGEPCLGVYAEVVEPGTVRVGDLVEVI
jgi:MOSC domain-containing protein YiiM